MIDVSKLIESVFDDLLSWDGYPVFKELFLDNHRYPVYLSGGVLRNKFMGSEYKNKDFDFFTCEENLDSELKELKKYGSICETPYGAPRWFPRDSNIYADIMPIKSFSPGLWPCLDIIDILNQFDFTMNAIAIELNTAKIHDPVNGIRDASKKILKMVRFDYPEEPFLDFGSINRNAILWIRAIHYVSKFNLSIEPITLAWMQKNKHFEDDIHLFSDVFFNPKTDFLLNGGI